MKLIHELRGLRNNNPGNLEKSTAFKWDGEVESLPGVPDESRFCQFSGIDYGIRAIFRILKTYREKYGLNTIEGIINRYAPPGENDTESYIQQICVLVGKTKNKPLDYNGYPFLVKAIIKHENGFCPFALDYIHAVFGWAVPEWQEVVKR